MLASNRWFGACGVGRLTFGARVGDTQGVSEDYLERLARGNGVLLQVSFHNQAKNRRITWLVLIAVLALPAVAPVRVAAATIRVERDGSGDYAAIQPALDAAASGDTILIGPGEYTEYSMVRLDGYAWDVAVFAYSELPRLTLMGVGAEQTLIGPPVPMLDYSTFSAKCLVWISGSELNLRGVTLRNCYEGLHANSGRLDLEECRISGHAIGVVWTAGGADGRLRSITFTSAETRPDALLIYGPTGSVSLTGIASTGGGRIYFDGAQGVLLDDCDLAGDVTSLSCVSGSDVTIRNSYLHSLANQQIDVRDASCTVLSCVLEGGDAGIVAAAYSLLTVTGSVVTGAVAAIACTGAERVTVHNSHVLRGGQWAIWASGPVPGGQRTYDLSGNYWGTATGAEIAAWIWDSRDNSANQGTVIYEPFSTQEVATEPTSWGDLKALWR